MGGGAPVVVQSMTLTYTHDVDATMEQIGSARVGRMRARSRRGAEAARTPRRSRSSSTSRPLPVMADIHFNASLALKAIEAGVAKVRINPGNIGGPDKVAEVVKAAKAKGIPMRVGANSGSLPKHLCRSRRRTPRRRSSRRRSSRSTARVARLPGLRDLGQIELACRR